MTCEVSVQYLNNSSNGYTSNITSVIEAKSLKVGPGLQIFLKFFQMLLTPKWYQMNLFQWTWGYYIQSFSSISAFLKLWQTYEVYFGYWSKIVESRPRFAKSKKSLHLQRFSFTWLNIVASVDMHARSYSWTLLNQRGNSLHFLFQRVLWK